jgi:hypothetical protein
MQEDRHQGWTWSPELHIIYHPRGCKVCTEYGQYIMQAKFSMDDAFVAAKHLREEEVDFWWKKATRYMDELDDADAHCRCLEDRIRELEDELAGPCEYEDRQGNKQAHLTCPMGWVQV